MASGKRGFMLYADQKHVFDLLDDAKAGQLIKTILAYVNDEDPIVEDSIIAIAFEPIKWQLKRDLIKREQRAARSRENGTQGGRPPGRAPTPPPPQEEPKKPSGLQNNPDEPRKPDNVTVTVTDTVNVSVTNSETHTHDRDFNQKIEPSNEILEPMPWFNELVASTAEASIYAEEQKKAPEEPAYDKTARIAKQRHAETYSTFLARTWEKHTGKVTLVTDTLKRRVLTISDTMPAADLEKFMETYGELYNFIETHDLRKHIYYPIRQYDLEKFLEKINIFTTDSFTVLGNITVKESTSKVLALWKKDHNIVDERTPPPPPVEEKVELTAEQKQKAKDKLQGFKKNLVDKVTT